MTADRDQFHPPTARTPEPLPIEFDLEQVEVDQLLSRSMAADARREIPEGLSHRIFAMTASALPTPVAGETQPRLRLVEAEAVKLVRGDRWMHAAWGRVALAASVLVVAGLTLKIAWPKQSPQPVAHGNGAAPVPDVRAASIDLTDLNHFDAANPSAFDVYESNFSYLLDASEVRSFDDLNSDLRLFVAQMEM